MKQKRQLIALIVLGGIAAVVWSFEWRGDPSNSDPYNILAKYEPLGEKSQSLHWGELELAQKTEYKSSGRSLFTAVAVPAAADPAHPIKPVEKPFEPQGPPAPKPGPTTSSLPPNLKYFGYAIPKGEPRKAFFTDGEATWVLKEGDTLAGRFRIVHINNNNVEFQEISSGLPGKTPLEEQAAPPSV
jgi:hypothetical protein